MRVEIIEHDTIYEFEDLINRKINGENIKDIKFSAIPNLRNGFNFGQKYYAMIIYRE